MTPWMELAFVVRDTQAKTAKKRKKAVIMKILPAVEMDFAKKMANAVVLSISSALLVKKGNLIAT